MVGYYSGDYTDCTALLGPLRADAMAKLYKKHAGDLDVAAMYAESLMVLKPWAMWTRDPVSGDITPAIEGTLVAKDVLERVRLFCLVFLSLPKQTRATRVCRGRTYVSTCSA